MQITALIALQALIKSPTVDHVSDRSPQQDHIYWLHNLNALRELRNIDVNRLTAFPMENPVTRNTSSNLDTHAFYGRYCADLYFKTHTLIDTSCNTTIARETNHIVSVYLGWIGPDLPTTSHVIDVFRSTDAYNSLGFSQDLYASITFWSAHKHNVVHDQDQELMQIL